MIEEIKKSISDRDIKFRVRDRKEKEMIYDIQNCDNGLVYYTFTDFVQGNGKDCDVMQYTGLKDKNGLAFIFEMDIINSEGLLVGNYYENEGLLKDKTNLLIRGFGTKDWCTTNKKAMDRGCRYS